MRTSEQLSWQVKLSSQMGMLKMLQGMAKGVLTCLKCDVMCHFVKKCDHSKQMLFNCLDFRARNITSAMMEKDRALMEKEEEVSNQPRETKKVANMS